MSVERLMSTTSRNIRGPAQDLARYSSHSDHLVRFFETELIVAFDRLHHFFASIQDKLRHSTIQGCMIDKPDADIIYWCPVSGILSEETLRIVRKQLNEYQHAGRCDTAYFLKCYHLQHFPHQFTEEDRDQLQELAINFTHILRNLSWQTLDYRAPEPFWSAFLDAPILPHEYCLIQYAKQNRHVSNISLRWEEPLPHEMRSDCLGRCISQVVCDYGYSRTWRDVDLHCSDFLSRTAMYQACRIGDIALIGYLLDNGADFGKATITGVSPLHVAASRGSRDICALIIRADKQRVPPCQVQSLTDCASRTPVMCAAGRGRLPVTEFFCKEVLMPHELHQLGPALEVAFQEGQFPIVDFLLKYARQFDIEERDADGHAAMSFARTYGHDEIDKELAKALQSNCGPEEMEETSRTFCEGVETVLQDPDWSQKLTVQRTHLNLGFGNLDLSRLK
jgi:hypothetical protein